ncbi:MAG: ATP-binding protein, partial [Candidatus Omnitrophota bacterium]
MIFKIHQRLTLIFSLIFAVVFFGIYLYLENALTRDAYLRIQENLRQKISLSRIYVDQNTRRKDFSSGEWDSAADQVGQALGLRATIIAKDGTVLGDSDLTPSQVKTVENHLYRPEVQKALKTGLGEERRYSLTLKKDMLYMARPVTQSGPEIIVRLAIPLSEIEHVSRHLQLLLIFSFIFAFGISVLLSFVASGYFSKPLKEMSQIAKRIAAGDFSQRVFPAGKDELSDLASSINYMSEHIRMRIEDVAKEKSRLEAVLLSMFEGVLVIDYEGYIRLMNEPFKKIFHVNEEPTGKHTLEIIRNIKVQEIVDTVLKQPQGVESAEISVLLPQEKIFLVHASPIIRGDFSEGVVVVFHDITELRRMERVRREFVANVSHELRTPLASIKGYAETLLDGALADKENAEEFLKIIHMDAERLARLIKDILDLSKVESGVLKLNLKPVSIRQVADRILEGLQRQIAGKALSINNDVPANVPQAMADEDRIAQVLLNLVDNAVQYTPQGGEIKISARAEGSILQVNVTDTGIGIPEEDLPRLFERFYRVDKARSRELGGTGLGLSIVKHIVLAHGGQVSVRSEFGRGSTFS